MKPEIASLIGKVRVWKTFIVRKVKAYSKQWLDQVIQIQSDWY
ncbi:hypothetical protein [Polynucleobacter necessarius]|nr:hypothetical protein [Polynucleobacter necessarius]